MWTAYQQRYELPVSLSARTQYATVAILELALRYDRGEPVPLRSIAEPHGIPLPFLVQILLRLKAAGIVESMRGASGGYRLIRSPASLTLGQIVGIMDGSSTFGSALDGTSRAASVLVEAWREADQAQQRCWDSTTFAMLVDRARGLSDVMYYI